MSIQILSQEVVNQIAAGEVVERPAHLVKELLENSLDASSSTILIEVSYGGRFIKITDNGSGISVEDLPLALLRHATSKIKQSDDLWHLNTFGFRGEALASAAAVSHLSLASQGQQIRCEFGKLSELLPASHQQGCQIIIDRLFENVPARLKFLKTDATEMSQIRQVVKAMALVNPQTEFKLLENGQMSLYFPSHDKKLQKKSSQYDEPIDFLELSVNRAKQVLGSETVFFESFVNSQFQVKVYFTSPHEVQKTSKNIWIFTQKRWVQDRALQAAVLDAFRSLLMHGEYPQVVVDLQCHSELIDVNIHPTKSQVKFQNSSDAFKAVHYAVRNGLEKAPWLTSNEPRHKHVSIEKNAEEQQASFNQNSTEQMGFHNESVSKATFFKTKPDFSSFKNEYPTNVSQVEQLKQLKINSTNSILNSESSNISEPISDKQIQSHHQQTQKSTLNGVWSSLQVLGQLNLTYIVCQKEDRMVLVDQHAAHERVAFEKLMSLWKGGKLEKQDYLFPLAVDLSVEKVEALLGYENEFQKMGIEIEMLGPSTLGVKSAPALIKDSVFPKVLEKMAQEIISFGGSYSLEKSIIDIFATMACHSVVRAGQSLSRDEMKQLLIDMDEFPLSSFCPHGRPVSVEYKFTDIEKSFGRIV